MLEIKNLHVKLEEEDKVILRGVDLSIGAGEACFVSVPECDTDVFFQGSGKQGRIL